MLSHNNVNHRQETLADMWAQGKALKALSHHWISASSIPAVLVLALYFSCTFFPAVLVFVLYFCCTVFLCLPLSFLFISLTLLTASHLPLQLLCMCVCVLEKGVWTSLIALQHALLSLFVGSAIHCTSGGLAPNERAAWTSSWVLRSLYLCLSPAISLACFLPAFYPLAHTLAHSSIF